MCGRRIEGGLVGVTGGDRVRHGVVALEDETPGPVLAVELLVLLADDPEGVEDPGDVVAGDAVQVEERGVEFGAQERTAGVIPAERGAVVADVVGEVLEVPGGVGELEDAGEEPVQ